MEKEIISVRVNKEMKFFLKQFAKEEDKDLSKKIREILEDYLKENMFNLDFHAGLW